MSAGGQASAQFFHPRLHPLCCGKRIGAGCQLDRHTGHRFAVKRGGGGIILRADFDPGDFTQPHDGGAGIGAQDDIFEFLRRRKPPVGCDGGCDLLTINIGQRAQRTASGLAVLFLNGGKDRAGRQIVRRQRLRIEPDTHGVLRTEQGDITNPFYPPQFIDDLVGGDIAEIGCVQRAVG